PIFRAGVDHILFASRDSAGAIGGAEKIARMGLDIMAISGVLTNSPLAANEARKFTGLPVVDTAKLCDPEACQTLLHAVREKNDSMAV
ncbi:MAG TPA: hypothetical protein PLK99_08655, partial [Burkholderiales bacterium]|nr:hypothetical protein [Burkholderiales bacterium]